MTDIYSILTYLLLGLSIFSLWVTSSRYVWVGFLSGAAIFGLVAGHLNWIALIETTVFGLLIYISYKKTIPKVIRITTVILSSMMALGFYYHYLPGFNNWNLLSQFRFSTDSVPYSLYLNFDKTLIGLFILAFGFALTDFGKQWRQTLSTAFPIIGMGLITILLFAFITNYIRFDPKLPEITLIWALKNLFFVCVAEESIFRGAIQKNLTEKFELYKNGKYGALIVASLLFGLSHFWGGATYVLLASVAGLFYGYVYMITNRIESSILFHFTLNFIHFTLFSYPALQQ